MSKALLVIDLQNDYFPGGAHPLWNTDATLESILLAIEKARATGVPVILVQHVADASAGPAPFFNEGTDGVRIHPKILAAAEGAPVVTKAYADGFVGTTLDAELRKVGASELLVCGMMTQNCVTHTAISKSAEGYDVKILLDCCTTVDAMIHGIALHAVSTRTAVVPSVEAL